MSVIYNDRKYELDKVNWMTKGYSMMGPVTLYLNGASKKISTKILDISQIKGIDKLTDLTGLFLMNNEIQVIKGLDELENLKLLDLYGNQISKVESFKNKDNLKYLYLGKNPIYQAVKKAYSKKKKLSQLTPEEREKAGVSPDVWEIVVNIKHKPKYKYSPPIIG